MPSRPLYVPWDPAMSLEHHSSPCALIWKALRTLLWCSLDPDKKWSVSVTMSPRTLVYFSLKLKNHHTGVPLMSYLKMPQGLPWRSSGQDCASNAGGAGLIPVRVTGIPHAAGHGQKKPQNPKQTNKKRCPRTHLNALWALMWCSSSPALRPVGPLMASRSHSYASTLLHCPSHPAQLCCNN